jgi:hypothetical protein
MPVPPPIYPKGSMTVAYDRQTHDVVKREVRNGQWWYKIRPFLNIFGGTWVPENDPYLRHF